MVVSARTAGGDGVRIEGEHRFSLPRSEVWARLQDPSALRRAIPGCVAFDEAGAPGAWNLTVEAGIGPVRGAFAGSVALADLEPESRYTLRAEGSGRPGGVSGEAAIALADDGAGTRLRYDAEVTIRGPVARVGGRLLTSTARTMARQFFEAIERGAQAEEEGAA